MCRITLANRLRINETDTHFKRLDDAFDTWIKGVRGTEFGSLINTPLNSLDDVLRKTIESIKSERAGLIEVSDKGDVYSKCRRIDQKTIWTLRLWDFDRERIDQRRVKAHMNIVAAADEVAWSYFLSAFQANDGVQGVVQGPSPLP